MDRIVTNTLLTMYSDKFPKVKKMSWKGQLPYYRLNFKHKRKLKHYLFRFYKKLPVQKHKKIHSHHIILHEFVSLLTWSVLWGLIYCGGGRGGSWKSLRNSSFIGNPAYKAPWGFIMSRSYVPPNSPKTAISNRQYYVMFVSKNRSRSTPKAWVLAASCRNFLIYKRFCAF